MLDLSYIIDQIVLSAFILFVSVTYIWCLKILFSLRKTRALDMKSILVLLLGAFGIVCFVYGFIEPFHLEVTSETVKSSKLKTNETIRIVHISDLHLDGIKRVVDDIPKKVKTLQPDFVVFTGDACHNKEGLADFRDCLFEISKICPVFAVKGNHDTRGVRYWDIFKETGAQELNCSSKTLSIRNTSVWIGGIAVDSESCMKKVLLEAPKDSFSVFLYHYPEGAIPASDTGIDLVCAGHTHGGQVRLPLYGALITASGLSRSYDRGLFDFKGTKLHISQGTGMTGVPIRFLAPPQITLIEIESDQAI